MFTFCNKENMLNFIQNMFSPLKSLNEQNNFSMCQIKWLMMVDSNMVDDFFLNQL